MRPAPPLAVFVGLVLIATAPVSRGAAGALQNETLVYVASGNTQTPGKGIYGFRLQTSNAEVSQNILLIPLGLAAEIPSPQFLAVDRQRRLVFAVNYDSFERQPGGTVSA